jgi:hypothetical protein
VEHTQQWTIHPSIAGGEIGSLHAWSYCFDNMDPKLLLSCKPVKILQHALFRSLNRNVIYCSTFSQKQLVLAAVMKLMAQEVLLTS